MGGWSSLGCWGLVPPLADRSVRAGLHGRIASETPPGPTHSKGQTLGSWVCASMAQAGRRLRLALGVTCSKPPALVISPSPP